MMREKRLWMHFLLAMAWFVLWASVASAGRYTTNAVVTEASKKCLECHTSSQPGLVVAWEKGLHARKGIGCFECHQADPGEADAVRDHFGFTISPLVTPNDCGKCHPAQKESFLKSGHAKAAQAIESIDNYLGNFVEGYAAVLNGCASCHGLRVEIASMTGRPAIRTFPNSGIGRINPDGSMGNCNACHQRHDFRMDAVRKAETCGQCHLGPDHPQIEVWRESRHGRNFSESSAGLDFSKRPLILGKDEITVPNCVVCHLGATTNTQTQSSHDPGERLSWDIHSMLSSRRENWGEKRGRMMDVCRSCHGPRFAAGHFQHFDKAIALYNHKFAGPAMEILEALRQAEKLDANPVNEKMERDFFRLWHHQGRRARNGAAMMAPDQVHWQGFFEMAMVFYFELIPEAERLLPGVTREIMARPEHRWYKEGLSAPEDLADLLRAEKDFWESRKPEYRAPDTK